MATANKSDVMNKLAGKKLVFDGKFGYGRLERLQAVAKAQKGSVQKELDSKTDYLVLADLNGSKTIQKKAQALIRKGASIQTVDEAAFAAMVAVTDEELLELIRMADAELFSVVHEQARYQWSNSGAPTIRFHSENLKGADLTDFRLAGIAFERCDFSGGKFNHTAVVSAIDCDFSKVTGEHSTFLDITGSTFKGAELISTSFNGDFSGANFDAAKLLDSHFFDWTHLHSQPTPRKNVSFVGATLTGASFSGMKLVSPDFTRADLSNASLQNCTLKSAQMRDAILRKANLVRSTLHDADLRNADLSFANLAQADLTGAKLSGANLEKANLRGTTLNGVDLSKVRNYVPPAPSKGAVGPALTELESIVSQARRVQFSFRLRASDDTPTEEVSFDSSAPNWAAFRVSGAIGGQLVRSPYRTYSQQMLDVADCAGHLSVCFETVEVSTTKSPKSGKELRNLVMQAIAEAFGQTMPEESELAAATKQWRAAKAEEGAAAREQMKQARLAAEKLKEKEKKKIAKKVEKTVGKVSDVASFLKALEVRIEKPKIQKATQMLKASGFKLFNDVTDESVSGVVKSQSDPDLVYACRVDRDGKYSCCTQNLNVCGGLRGSLCKHQLVLIIGLVQAGELDPAAIDGWIAKTHSNKPELDKDAMGEIFIKYKGAEAGEIDWRPTETVPEDYYAF